ncbi:hypothetical protein B0A52_06666 [Exophiala mesophila]|uniref:Tse2 ADP-ribosyltransferase toxin domain-containing protein n=1 Tax=Exophiala mesophila TaxID=212818 RepID=A0A438N1N0_EXOME|nr:hypothetical protein B0A52_06666 [Exophiala mesophila]
MSNRPTIKLRDFDPRRESGAYDVKTKHGVVQPIAMTSDTYQRPNGASMQANTSVQQKLVQGFKGTKVRVYCVPAETALPEDLVLVHEFGGHYSLQPKVEMTLPGGHGRAPEKSRKLMWVELNAKLTAFYTSQASALTKEDWQKQYPEATE